MALVKQKRNFLLLIFSKVSRAYTVKPPLPDTSPLLTVPLVPLMPNFTKIPTPIIKTPSSLGERQISYNPSMRQVSHILRPSN